MEEKVLINIKPGKVKRMKFLTKISRFQGRAVMAVHALLCA